MTQMKEIRNVTSSLKAIRCALISVYDKTGLVPFAQGLAALGIRIISSGGTAAALKNAGVACTEVAEITGFPEMLDGRVKTLHPRIHGGILAKRSKVPHLAVLKEHDIPLIDMVVVNLYPFTQTVESGKSRDEVIEMIDIGGPAMLRAAAKNHTDVAPVCDAADYPVILKELKINKGALTAERLEKLAKKTFEKTASYDAAVAAYLAGNALPSSAVKNADASEATPERLTLEFDKKADLRYGENPHQRGAVYKARGGGGGLPSAEVLGGKELSFNNYLDMESAWLLAASFSEPMACVIKHNNPCGAAVAASAAAALKRAYACDPLSAFGGIVGLNRPVDDALAKGILACGFLECIVAPDYTAGALELLRVKKNLRLVKLPAREPAAGWDYKRITGGVLLQDADRRDAVKADLKVVSKKKPTAREIADLLFAFKICRFVKSNAIVLVKNLETVGVGMGQPSRIDSALTAFRKAGKRARGAVLASDGFFPKPDTIGVAKKHGITAIIQPGGSIQDKDVIAAADRGKIAMVITGIRHFTH